MSSDADKFWDEVAGKLRRLKGLCPPTPEEAEAAFDSAPDMPLSEAEIDSIAESVISGELTSWDPVPSQDWDDDPAVAQVGEEARQLFRNEGEEDPEADRVEKELENELLNDDEPKKDETGLADGAPPPEHGG